MSVPATSAYDMDPLGGSYEEDDVAVPGGTEPGPELLAAAAAALPLVTGTGPVFLVDLHTALYEAARVIGAGANRAHRLLLADEAFDLLVEYLSATSQIQPSDRPGRTIRQWLIGRDQVQVAKSLRGASGYWRQVRSGRDGPPRPGPGE